jgi:glutaryl-CoA dehydrogenase
MTSDRGESVHSGDDGLVAVDDYYRLDDTLSEQERAVRDRVRRFADAEVLPIIDAYWEKAEFPFELVPKLAQLGVVGTSIENTAARGCRRSVPAWSRACWRGPMGA